MEGWRFSAKDMIPFIKAVGSQVRNGGCLKGSILVHMLLDNELVELEHWLHLAMCPKCMKLYDEIVESGVRDEIRKRLSTANINEFAKEPGLVPTELPDRAEPGHVPDDASVAFSQPFWQIQTPSGLQFKFSDPEALLGWKKKITAYKSLRVSISGEGRSVDFAEFIAKFEESGDAEKSLAECAEVPSFGSSENVVSIDWRIRAKGETMRLAQWLPDWRNCMDLLKACNYPFVEISSDGKRWVCVSKFIERFYAQNGNAESAFAACLTVDDGE